jgi:hypothetical protein
VRTALRHMQRLVRRWNHPYGKLRIRSIVQDALAGDQQAMFWLIMGVPPLQLGDPRPAGRRGKVRNYRKPTEDEWLVRRHEEWNRVCAAYVSHCLRQRLKYDQGVERRGRQSRRAGGSDAQSGVGSRGGQQAAHLRGVPAAAREQKQRRGGQRARRAAKRRLKRITELCRQCGVSPQRDSANRRRGVARDDERAAGGRQ